MFDPNKIVTYKTRMNKMLNGYKSVRTQYEGHLESTWPGRFASKRLNRNSNMCSIWRYILEKAKYLYN